MRPEENPDATAAERRRFIAFLAALEAEGLSPATRACYGSDWWNLSEATREATGRPFRLDGYRDVDFLAYRAREAARGVSPATLNRRLAFLRRYAAYAGARGTELDRVPFQPVVRLATRALTPAEEEALRKAAVPCGPATAAVVALLLGTGLRASEAAALRRRDVVGTAHPKAVRIRGPRRKTVLLPPRASAPLGALLSAGRVRPDEPVFVGPRGEAVTEARLASWIADAAGRAGVEATPRTLRHTFAVRYLQEHRDDVEGLARALGQSGLGQARSYRDEANEAAPKARRLRWEDVPVEGVTPAVSRQVLRGSRLEAVRYVYRPGAEFRLHAHPEEQMTFVLSGRIAFRSGRQVLEAGPGDVVHLPSGVPHGAYVSGDRTVVTLNVFSPVRKALPDARAP
jgi:integrase